MSTPPSAQIGAESLTFPNNKKRNAQNTAINFYARYSPENESQYFTFGHITWLGSGKCEIEIQMNIYFLNEYTEMLSFWIQLWLSEDNMKI